MLLRATAIRAWPIVVFFGLTPQGFAQSEPPLPPPRPADATAPAAPPPPAQSPPPSETPRVEAQAPPEGNACLERLKALGFDIETAEPPKVSNDQCRIDNPVRLKAVPNALKTGRPIRLPEHPILSCGFAEPFGRWIGELVAPVVAGIRDTELTALRTGPGFECRNRNRATTGKLSAHAQGIAIDIAGFELANGTTIGVKAEGERPSDPTFATIRKAGCGWFTTILGPGSDAAHHDHLHVDILTHGSSDRYRICD